MTIIGVYGVGETNEARTMPQTESGRDYEYSCDSCDYQGEEYDRKPTEPEGEQVRCPECGKPHLVRVLVS